MNRERINAALRQVSHVAKAGKGVFTGPGVAVNVNGPLTDEKLKRQADGSVKFKSEAGTRAGFWYHAYDCIEVRGRLKRKAMMSSEATVRVFIMAGGDRWIYTFAPRERRVVTFTALERQLLEATYSLGNRAKAGHPR